MIELWTVNRQIPNTSPLPNFGPSPNFTKCQTPVINKEIIPQLQAIPGKNMKFLPLSTKLQLKNRRRMLFFPMDSGERTLDALIQTGAVTCANSAADLQGTRLLAPQKVLNEEIQPELQIIVPSGHLKMPSATVELQVGFWVDFFKKVS